MGPLDYGSDLPGFYSDSRKLYPHTKLYMVVKPSAQWNPPVSSRVVHWVRDPVDMIASAYRYLTEGQEQWMFRSMHCNYCDHKALQILADACLGLHEQRHCNFHNLVHSVNVTEGALYVATVLQRQLQDMADNLHRWANSGRVLHLSVKALGQDFDGTAACILKFARVETKQQASLRQEIQRLDIHRHSKDNAGHVTSGKYDNTEIQEFLRSQPVWGAQFAKFASALDAISTRQQRIYGCPSIS